MKKRPMGQTGAMVSVIGQGTWRMERDNPAQCRHALLAGIDAGMTHIDTAEMYGSGRVETLLHDVVVARRSELYLVSKVQPVSATRKGTITACEKSLQRLGTDHLDCYLLHWPGEHPLEDTIAAFEELVRDGKILAWGVSNFDVPELEAALKIAGPGRIACNQVLYHLEERAIEFRVLPFCALHGITVTAYSPFGAGSFVRPATMGGRALAQVARHHGSAPFQVALAFLTHNPAVVAIPKSTNPAHVVENAGAASVTLTPEDFTTLEAAFPVARPGYALPVL